MLLPAIILATTASTQPLLPPDANGLLTWSIREAQPEIDNDFAAELTSNMPWMRELLDSGPIKDLSRSIAFLELLWKDNPDLSNRQVDRSMATACALEIGERGRDEEKMQQIFDFFVKHHAEEDLNPCFDTLATWERRFLARGVQHGGYNAIASQEYLLENLCWPRSGYVNACWQAPYRLNNCFGDSIHGSMYYHPFAGAFDNSAEQTLTVGAVCGGLSNVGAAAAIANGIPAFTMGEPGHCAYAVETAPGKWSPAYSLSWKRGLHTSINRPTWPSHMLTQASFSNPEAVAKANDQRRLARWHVANDDPAAAFAALRNALRLNPLDEAAWEEAFILGAAQNADDKWWSQTTSRFQNALLPAHPEPTWTLLWKHVFPQLLREATTSERTRQYIRFLAKLDGWGSVRWNLEASMNAMDGSFANADERNKFELEVVENLVNEPALGPVALSWATSKVGDDQEKKDRLEKTLLQRTKGKGEGRDAILHTLARTTLPTAAAEHDLDTFQRVGRAASRLFKPLPTLKSLNIKPFPGTLLSSGGAISIFKPGNRWDNPARHWGVLEECGGDFHTENGTLPWFEIELPRFGQLSGIILEGRHGQQQRYEGARILISSDGEEWEHIATLEGRKNWYQINLADAEPRGRFVRVERDGQCLHFQRVLIYGRRAS